MKNKKYLATYWRNDGDWHDADYNYNPSFIFEASNDAEALELAIEYPLSRIRKVRLAENDFIPTREDFELESLREIRDISFFYNDRERIKDSLKSNKIKTLKKNFKEIDSCRTIVFEK